MKKFRPLAFVISLMIVITMFPATANAAITIPPNSGSFDDTTGTLTITSDDFWTGWSPTFPVDPINTHGITPSEVKNIVVSGLGVTNIPESAAEENNGFSELRTVDMSNATGLTEIGLLAFYGATITSLQLPPNLQHIGTMAFDSIRINSLDLPHTLQSIGTSAFNNSIYLKGLITIPESVSSVGATSFPSGNSVTLKFLSATPPRMNGAQIVGDGEATILYPLSAINAYTNPTPLGITGFTNLCPFLDTNNILGEQKITLSKGYETTSFNYDLLSDKILGFDSDLKTVSPSSDAGYFTWNGTDNKLSISKGLGIGTYELTIQQVDTYGSPQDLIINVVVTGGATPDTGDSFPLGILLGLILLSGSIFLLRRKALRSII